MEITLVLKFTWLTQQLSLLVEMVWAVLPTELNRVVESNPRKVVVTMGVMALLVMKLLMVSAGVWKVLLASAGVLMLVGAKLLLLTAGLAAVFGATLQMGLAGG